MLENIYAPMPFSTHIIFCIIATIFYFIQYKRKGFKHYIYLILAIDSTIFTQFYNDSVVMFVLGFEEAILLVMIIFSMTKISIEHKKEFKALTAMDNIRKAEIPVENPVDEAFSDEE